MTAIVTITPNPAVDVSTTVEKIVPVAKLRGSEERRDPGGGGINVARIVTRFGGDAVALYPVGGLTGALLRQLLDREGITSLTWSTAGETREDFFVTERATGQPYRFILPGPTLSETEWQSCLSNLAGLVPFPRFVVGSGSLPAGAPVDFYARVAAIAHDHGARMILDTSGPALSAAVEAGVDLIKPSLQEMRELAGSELSDSVAWEDAARALVACSKVETVALTMGHLGAILVTGDQVLRAAPLAITPVSAVGAGDSFLGTLLFQLASGAARDEAFRWAVAAGAAALLNTGTALCDPADVRRLAAEVVLQAT